MNGLNRSVRTLLLGSLLAFGVTHPVIGAEEPKALPKPVAQTAGQPAAKAQPKVKTKAPVKAPAPIELPPDPASEEQIAAAERVFHGDYQCEFKQMVHIKPSEKHPSYVDLKHGSSAYLMKPVLSSTGAIRLEDVRGHTLMVQIASKSMLMNVKSGTRLLDGCVCPKQRELMDAAMQAAELEAKNTAAPPER